MAEGAGTVEELIAQGADTSEIARAAALDIEAMIQEVKETVKVARNAREAVDWSNYATNLARMRHLQVGVLTGKGSAPPTAEDGWEEALRKRMEKATAPEKGKRAK